MRGRFKLNSLLHARHPIGFVGSMSIVFSEDWACPRSGRDVYLTDYTHALVKPQPYIAYDAPPWRTTRVAYVFVLARFCRYG